MPLKSMLMTLVLAVLAACGGSVSIGLAFVSDDEDFLFWAGSSNRDLVIDANRQGFAFFADSHCLYNFQTGRENREFCLAPSGDTALYRGFPVRVAIVRSSTGACVAALLDEARASFIGIELDGSGTEIILVTSLRPELCPH